LFPAEIGPEDLADMHNAGVTVGAVIDATYVCVGFNIIARIADALGFKIPSEELFLRAARLLRIFGYRRLSGFWTSGFSDRERRRQRAVTRLKYRRGLASYSPLNDFHDPYRKKMERLRYAVVSGPGTLAPEVRKMIIDGGKVPGRLGGFARKVAEHAFNINDDDIAELHRAHYTDDQIFEAAVTSALGAGLFRLECVLAALRLSQLAANTHVDLRAQGATLRPRTRLKVTA
jgi:alkylhydroperoxidase family enzyme